MLIPAASIIAFVFHTAVTKPKKAASKTVNAKNKKWLAILVCATCRQQHDSPMMATKLPQSP